MELLKEFIDIFLHLDTHLDKIFSDYGTLTYIILGLVIFCETGLVITPFLPGDSLLFAVGALSAGSSLNIHLVVAILIVCAILGDAVNYHIGKFIGPKVFEKKDSKIFRQSYLKRTQDFYDKYGGKTIIIARFVPIVRTFAPFLAGVGEMSYAKFFSYNVIGAILWVGIIAYAGYFFGELDIVKNNFSLVILGIIIVSVLPAVCELWAARKSSSTKGAKNTETQRRE